MPDMQKLSELQLPDGSEYYIQDDSAIASISRSGNLFTATKRNGDTFTFSQKDITISSNPSNPNIITITDNDGNTYDVDIVISDATQSASGLMSATDKTKLDGVASGAEVNQFAFSTVEVTQGQTVTTLSADSKTDTLSIVAGDNITLTPTAVSDRVVFSAKDTTYTLIQDSTDKHKFTLHDSDGNDTTITIPDKDTTYTLSADPATGKIVLTPSSGSPISITVPNATHADSATADEDGDDIRTTYATSLDQNPSDGHVLQLKDKNGNVLSTATVPDNNTTYTFENGTNGFSVTPSGGSKQTVTVTPSIADATQSKSGLMSANDKKKLDGVEAGADVNVIETVKVNGTALTPDANKAVNVTVPTKTSDLTNDSDYVSDASYVHTDNNYTSTEKSKLAGIASGAEVNQNAFSNVKVGTTTIAADGKTDTLELSAGSNISLTPDATNDKVTIAVTGLGTAATKNFTTSVTSGSVDLVTSGAVASAISSAIDDLPEPMIFQGTLGTGGTITTLPTASSSNIGYTYKVITAGTYGGVASKVGDTFVSTELPKGSGTYTWVHIPSGDDIEDTWRNIKINGTEKLGTGISSGAVDFVNGNATTVSFNATGNKVSISHADTSSQASVNNSGRTYVQDITLDEYGHVTGIASATETVTNTDRYVNSASFADDTTASANSPVKMTLTRAGSDTVSVTANIPKVSSSSAGVAPKGSAVSSQSQSTKFLREDGSWAAPTYTVNTDTKVTAVGNHYTPAENTGSQLDADASSTTAATWNSTSLVTGVTIKRDAKGHVTGLAVDSIKMPANPNVNTTYTFAEGSTNGAFSVTPSGGSAQSVPIHGLKSAAYTESSAYATSGHTHATSIATSTGTNQITLAHGGKYAITAGGTSYIFTMPSDNNTDTLVTQTATSTNATYEVLFSATADNTTRTETARKNNNLTFNPSTGTLSTTNVSASSAIATNDLDTNYLTTGSASITEANVGDLIVTGAARFLNTINGSISGNAATATNVAWSGVTGKPTTLAGYGITDAKIANGVITLGSNTITPLTSHQTVSNKGATLAWSTTSTIATIGGTDIKVTMPGNPNTNTTYTLSADTTNNKITLTPSSGTAQSITVPYATTAGSANSVAWGNVSGKPSTYAPSVGSAYYVQNLTGASRATTTGKSWVSMMNSSSTGSPVLPTVGKWWHVLSLDCWNSAPNNWVSQLAIATQDTAGVWYRKNPSSGTSIDEATWNRLAEGDTSGNAVNANKVNNLTVQTAVPANAKFTDTNTHRPIQMNGTEILGNNTTALNLKAGTNVSLSNSSGTVTITATDTTYSAGTGLTLSGTQFSISAANASTIMNLLTTGSSAPTDNDYYIAQYAGGGTSTTTYHRRPHSALWSYIKSKADSTYLASTTKYAGSSSVGGAANSANQLNDDTSYINSGTSYVTHTTASTLRPFLTRFNNVGIGTESHGCLVLSNNWSSNVYNAELLLGMGDRPYIYFRGKNNGTYTTWLPVGKFSAVPTTGQVVITDGTEGGIKSSGYTIAKSVPSNAVFTDQNVNQSVTTTSNWRKIVLSYQDSASAGTAVTANTNVVYVTPNAEIQPSTGTIRSAGHMIATVFGVNQSNGTGGGISLYQGAGYETKYGIAFRTTANLGKHGYVQSDWATYFTMDGADTRGWVFRNAASGKGNVASISSAGNMVLNGSLTVGGNVGNNSGMRLVWNSSTSSLDFVVA